MVLSNAQQISVLLWSLLFGGCLGAAYDLLRAFRVFVRCPSVAVAVQDLVYFLIAAVASFLFIFEVNDGTVRLFILLSFFVGGLAERFTVGQLFLRLCRRIQSFFSRRIHADGRNTRKTNARILSKAGKHRCIRESNN